MNPVRVTHHRLYHFPRSGRAVVWPTCEICKGDVPLADIRAYQHEAGDRSILPCCCADCAVRQ